MNQTDLEIIDLLQRDARATQAQIAKAVGLSQPAVAERVRKLEERGVIQGYVARVDPAALGLDVTAFVGVTIEHPKYFEAFGREIETMEEVLEAHRVAGEDSYLLKVRTKNTSTLDQLLVERLRMIPGVSRTQTTIVLSSIKESTRLRPLTDPPRERP
jgi:Lrp/AsnC family leucine-responsive transcriptional regulator